MITERRGTKNDRSRKQVSRWAVLTGKSDHALGLPGDLYRDRAIESAVEEGVQVLWLERVAYSDVPILRRPTIHSVSLAADVCSRAV